MPGFICSSGMFVTNGRQKSLAYILADRGYDVWIGNGRGTTYSRKHLTLDPDRNTAQFWNFSIHEVGYYDVRASIDYILNAKKKKNLVYIGHSQGVADFLILVSGFTQYNKKVRLVVALSPTSYMSHYGSPILRLLTLFTGLFIPLTKLFGIYEILHYYSKFYVTVTKTANKLGLPSQILVATGLFLTLGFDYQQYNYTWLPVIGSVGPAGASTYQVAHYGQLINSGRFCQFNYGKKGNLKQYGQEVPPEYQLENVEVPVAIYYGSSDYAASPAVRSIER